MKLKFRMQDFSDQELLKSEQRNRILEWEGNKLAERIDEIEQERLIEKEKAEDALMRSASILKAISESERASWTPEQAERYERRLLNLDKARIAKDAKRSEREEKDKQRLKNLAKARKALARKGG